MLMLMSLQFLQDVSRDFRSSPHQIAHDMTVKNTQKKNNQLATLTANKKFHQHTFGVASP